MKIVIALDTKYDEHFVFCPCCLKYSEDNLIYSDYVTTTMLWCEDCDARCVLDLSIDIKINEIKKLTKIGDINTLKKSHPELNYKSLKNIDGNYIQNYEFFYVNLLFIENVINFKLDDYYSDNLVSQLNTTQFIESKYNKEMMNKFNIKKYDKSFFGYELTQDDYDKHFNLSIECFSYNAVCPKNKYPKSFELDHGGVYVHLKCKNNNNETVYVTYWGD